MRSTPRGLRPPLTAPAAPGSTDDEHDAHGEHHDRDEHQRGGIVGQTSALSGHLSGAMDTIEGWMKDLGVGSGTASDAKQHASTTVTAAIAALLNGLERGLLALSSLAFFLALTC